MFKLLALSGVGLVAGAAGDVTTLCNMLMTNCGWQNVTTCATLFTGTPNGTDTDATGDSIGCRQNYATMANASMMHYCSFAGASGGGLCGKPVVGACRGIIALCPAQYASQSACETTLGSFAALPGSNTGMMAANESSLECRVSHAMAGATDMAMCANTGMTGPCNGTVVANAAYHCAQLQGACTGNNQQYPNEDSCRASFGLFTSSPVMVGNTNDQGSRQYHGVAAVALADTSHCQHAGPSGGGLLGGTYQTWQQLSMLPICQSGMAQQVLGAVGQAYMNWAPADLMAIVPMGTGASTYNTANPPTGNNTELCRIYHLTVAASSAGAAVQHCAHGGVTSLNQCGMDAMVSCNIILQGCPNAYANSGACQTALGVLFAANKTGVMMPAPTDDSIACRVYNGGLALAAKKSNQTTGMDAACNAVMMYGGCGGNTTEAPTMAPTTNSAPVVGASLVLAVLPFFAL